MATELALDVLLSGIDSQFLAAQELSLPNGENPGIGGTQWTSLGVASLCSRAGLDVRVVIEGDFSPSRYEGFEVVACESFDALRMDTDRVVLAPEAIARRLGESWRRRRLIVVLHHPHAQNSIEFAKVARLRPMAFVSVGQYAWASNMTIGIPHYWIPNPFPRWALSERERSPNGARPDAPVFGFTGALLPAKGFHHVAAAWGIVRTTFPGARLQVVGSASLYGLRDGHSDIPTISRYGDEILEALGPHRGSVEFLGLVRQGKAAIYAGWDAAVLNPTGASEADPSSLKEVVAAGVPVAAGTDFGMWDIMQAFPELVIPRPAPESIAAVAVRALVDPVVLHRFAAARTRMLADILKRDDRLAEVWTTLITAVAEGRSRPFLVPGFRPDRPTGTVGRRLILRNVLGPVRWIQGLGRGARARVRAGRTAGRAGRRA